MIVPLGLLLEAGGHGSAEPSAASVSSYVVFAACLVLLVGALLLLIRALRGPTVFDRILAVNAMGTKVVVLVACLAFLDLRRGSPGFFLDTSIVYALINFIATIAILKYIQHRRLS
jgi:multicomponent Na+:H+ antiporter subunit F